MAGRPLVVATTVGDCIQDFFFEREKGSNCEEKRDWVHEAQVEMGNKQTSNSHVRKIIDRRLP